MPHQVDPEACICYQLKVGLKAASSHVNVMMNNDDDHEKFSTLWSTEGWMLNRSLTDVWQKLPLTWIDVMIFLQLVMQKVIR